MNDDPVQPTMGTGAASRLENKFDENATLNT